MIEDLSIPYTAVATDLTSGRPKWFQRGPIDTAIRASIAIPGVITPYVLDGRVLVDGGILDPVPIAPLAAAGADLIIGVDLGSDTGGIDAEVVPAPALAPIKFLAVVYADVFRGTPTLLIVLLVGFGVPALELTGLPTSLFWLGVVALTLSYGAYVSEVIRAGILSVHPTQWASGRAIGLSYGKTLRYIVLPQALRRVAPPLLNDFVSLQKDTALLSTIGLVESLRAAQVISGRDFVFTPYVVAACFFIVATIPFARFTDYLTVRSLRRENGL